MIYKVLPFLNLGKRLRLRFLLGFSTKLHI